MELISGYAWILPAVTAAGWVLSWWRARWVQWSLLGVSAVASAFCFLVGIAEKEPPIRPGTAGCSPAFACMDWHPVYWLEAGLIGFACCVVLMVVTVAVEAVLTFGRRPAMKSPR